MNFHKSSSSKKTINSQFPANSTADDADSPSLQFKTPANKYEEHFFSDGKESGKGRNNQELSNDEKHRISEIHKKYEKRQEKQNRSIKSTLDPILSDEKFNDEKEDEEISIKIHHDHHALQKPQMKRKEKKKTFKKATSVSLDFDESELKSVTHAGNDILDEKKCCKEKVVNIDIDNICDLQINSHKESISVNSHTTENANNLLSEKKKRKSKKAVLTPTLEKHSSKDVFQLYYDSFENPKRRQKVKFAQPVEECSENTAISSKQVSENESEQKKKKGKRKRKKKEKLVEIFYETTQHNSSPHSSIDIPKKDVFEQPKNEISADEVEKKGKKQKLKKNKKEKVKSEVQIFESLANKNEKDLKSIETLFDEKETNRYQHHSLDIGEMAKGNEFKSSGDEINFLNEQNLMIEDGFFDASDKKISNRDFDDISLIPKEEIQENQTIVDEEKVLEAKKEFGKELFEEVKESYNVQNSERKHSFSKENTHKYDLRTKCLKDNFITHQSSDELNYEEMTGKTVEETMESGSRLEGNSEEDSSSNKLAESHYQIEEAQFLGLDRISTEVDTDTADSGKERKTYFDKKRKQKLKEMMSEDDLYSQIANIEKYNTMMVDSSKRSPEVSSIFSLEGLGNSKTKQKHLTKTVTPQLLYAEQLEDELFDNTVSKPLCSISTIINKCQQLQWPEPARDSEECLYTVMKLNNNEFDADSDQPQHHILDNCHKDRHLKTKDFFSEAPTHFDSNDNSSDHYHFGEGFKPNRDIFIKLDSKSSNPDSCCTHTKHQCFSICKETISSIQNQKDKINITKPQCKKKLVEWKNKTETFEFDFEDHQRKTKNNLMQLSPHPVEQSNNKEKVSSNKELRSVTNNQQQEKEKYSSLSSASKKRVILDVGNLETESSDISADFTKQRYITVGGITIRQPTRDKIEILFDLNRNKNRQHNPALLDELMLTIANDEKRFLISGEKSKKLLNSIKPVYRRKIVLDAIKENFSFFCLPFFIFLLLLGLVFGYIFSLIVSPSVELITTTGPAFTPPSVFPSGFPPINGTLRVIEIERLSQVIVEELLQLSKLETIQWAQAGLATTLQSAFEMAELVVIRVTVTDIIFEELPGMRKLLRRSTELQTEETNAQPSPFILMYSVDLNNQQNLNPIPSLETILHSVRSSFRNEFMWKIDPYFMSLVQGNKRVDAFTLQEFFALAIPPLDFATAYETNEAFFTTVCPSLVVDSSVKVSPFQCTNSSEHVVDQVCYLSCDEGLILYGHKLVTCLPSGVWSQNNAFCGKPCAPLSPLVNGRISPSFCSNTTCCQNISPRSHCVHYCNKHFRLVGTYQRECKPNGVWTYSAPVCKRECPILKAPKFVGTSPLKCLMENSLEGDICVFSCEKNYFLQGASATSCDSNGRWTSDVPVCRKVCPGLQPMPNTEVLPYKCLTSTLFEGASCFYRCRKGFRLIGPRILTCLADSQWSGFLPYCKRECSPFGEISHGIIKPVSCINYHQVSESICSFSCDTGFTLKGAQTLTCSEEGFWTEKKPFCVVVCPPLQVPLNSILNCSGIIKNSTCTIRCLDGYRLKGPDLVTCRSDGTWNEFLGVCIKTCKPLEVPRYGSVFPYKCGLTGSLVGDSCTFQCENLYGLEGTVKRTCMIGGVWSGVGVTCNRQDQYYLILQENDINVCLTATNADSKLPEKQQLSLCANRPFDFWSIYDEKMIKNSGNGLCIGFEQLKLMAKLVFLPCNESDSRVIWEFPSSTILNYTLQSNGFYLWYGYSSASEVVALDYYTTLSNWLLQDPETKSKTTFFGALNRGKCPTLAAKSVGKWIPKKCAKSPSPPGTSCSFVCDASEKPNVKNTVVICATGSWEGETKPTCIKTCSSYDLGKIKNGMVTPFVDCLSELFVDQGTTCTVSCNIDYRLIGQNNIACLSNGKWSNSSPLCKKFCSPLILPSNGKLISTEFCKYPSREQETGAICRMGCINGYVVKGDEYVTCLESGDWSSYSFVCVRGCYPPPSPDNGNVICPSDQDFFPEGTICSYNCTNDRQLYPDSKNTTVCLSIGIWNQYPPTCQYFCPKLDNLTNGVIEPLDCTNSSIIPNDFKCSFSCNFGYILRGESVIECLSTGFWNKISPTCVLDTQFTLLLDNDFCLTAQVFPYHNVYKVLLTSPSICSIQNKAHLWSVNSFNQMQNVATRWCLSVTEATEGGSVKLVDCDSSRRNQRWECYLVNGYSIIRLVDTNFTLQSKNNYVFISKEEFRPETANWRARSIENDLGTLCGMVHGNVGTCPIIRISQGTNIDPQSCQSPVHINTTCSISCDEGFEMESQNFQKNITCELFGVWSSNEIYCRKRKCPALTPLPLNTYISSNFCINGPVDAFHDIPCVYSCLPGFYLNRLNGATEELYCLGNGKWSEPIPQCLRYCEKLFKPDNGQISPSHICEAENIIQENQVCSFTCDLHFALNISDPLQCKNGAWNGNVPSCQRISGMYSCPGFVRNRIARVYPMRCYDHRVPSNTACRVSCIPGYRQSDIEGDQVICQGNGKWSSLLPECKRLCPSFPAPPHSYFDSPKCNSLVLTEGETCKVICNTGYSLVQSGLITCTNTGKWDKSYVRCEKNSEFFLSIGQKCAYALSTDGYVYFGTCPQNDTTYMWEWHASTKIRNVFTQTCLVPETESSFASGKLISCDKVQHSFDCYFSNKTNGGLVYDSKLHVAKAVTDKPNKLFFVQPEIDNENYKDLFTTKLYAYNSTLNNLVSPCLFRSSSNCPILPDIANGYIEKRCKEGLGVFVGTRCTYFCESGYELVGIAERQCLNNGEWGTSPLVQCKKLCPLLQIPEFASVDNIKCEQKRLYEGESCMFACEDGYELAGTERRFCRVDGTWSGSAVICHRSCPPLMSMTLSPPFIFPEDCSKTTQKLGTKCTVTCPFGYSLVGNKIRVCLHNGSWSGDFIACRRACPPLGTVLDGKITPLACIQFGQYDGNTCEFTCDENFELKGASSVVCNSNGFWSDVLPKCLRKCSILNYPANGQHNCSWSETSPVEGETCKFICSPGYAVQGSDLRTCLETSQWSGIQPTCDREYQFVMIQSTPGVREFCLAVNYNNELSLEQSNCDFENPVYVRWAWHETYLIRNSDSYLCLAGKLLSVGSHLFVKNCNKSDSDQLWESGEPERNWFVRLRDKKLYPLHFFPSSNKILLLDEKSLDLILYNSAFGESKHTYWYAKTPSVARLPISAARKIKSCSKLVVPNNTMVSPKSCTTQQTPVGEACYFSCIETFKLIRPIVLTECLLGGIWSHSIPLCVSACLPFALNVFENLIASPSSCLESTFLPERFVCRFSCPPNSNLLGNSVLTCQKNGKWNYAVPVCVATCSAVNVLQHGKIIPEKCTIPGERLVEGTLCSYHCLHSEHILTGVSVRKCTYTGEWDQDEGRCVKPCPNHPKLEGGYIKPRSCSLKLSIPGTICSFFCEFGFIQHGPAFRACLTNGSWSGKTPTCQPLCRKLIVPANGILSPESCLTTNSAPQKVCVLSCFPGFGVKGVGSTVCTNEGTWSLQLGECVTRCPKLPKPENGLVSPRSCLGGEINFGHQCSFACQDGFSRQGSEIRFCNAKGRWTGEKAICKAACKALGSGNNIYDIPENCRNKTAVYGVKCESVCIPTTTARSGKTVSEAVCKSNGIWNGSIIDVCYPTCSVPYIQNGFLKCENSDGIDINSLTYITSTVCTVVCDQNYIANSWARSECMLTSDGPAWSPKLAECRFEPEVMVIVNRVKYDISCLGVQDEKPVTFDWENCGNFNTTWIWDSQYHIRNTITGRCLAVTSPVVNEIVTTLPCDIANNNQKWICYDENPYALRLQIAPLFLDVRVKERKLVVLTDENSPYTNFFTYNPQSISGYGTLCSTRSLYGGGNVCVFPNLPDPLALEYGCYLGDEIVIGTSCTVQCSEEVSENITCQENGKWKPELINVCQKSCSAYSEPLSNNTMFEEDFCLFGQIPFGYFCSVICAPGYISNEGLSGVTCSYGGKWTNLVSRTCVASCPEIKPVPNGILLPSKCVSGVCELECNPGYSIEGSKIRVCMNDGSWSGTSFDCLAEVQFQIANTAMYKRQTLCLEADSSMKVTKSICFQSLKTQLWRWNSQFTLINIQFQKCLAINTARIRRFSLASQAKTKKSQTNSSFSRNMKQISLNDAQTSQVVIKDCDSADFTQRWDCGLSLEPVLRVAGRNMYLDAGALFRPHLLIRKNPNLLTTRWLGQYFTYYRSICAFRNFGTCKPLSDIPNGRVRPVACKSQFVTAGTRCEYSCDTNFVLKGRSETTCLINGEWSHQPSSCLGMNTCPQLKNHHYLQALPKQCLTKMVREGQICHFTCIENTILEGKRSVSCLSNGSWDATTPNCEVICPALQPPDGGEIIPQECENSYLYPSFQCESTCEESRNLTGDVIRTCSAEGTWIGEDAVCKHTCPPLSVEEGQTTPAQCLNSSIASGEVCHIRCNYGYTILGKKTVWCNDGIWEDSSSSCVSDTCSRVSQNMDAIERIRYIGLKNGAIVINSIMKITCNRGYRPLFTNHHVCYKPGVWSGGSPECEMTSCPALNTLYNGIITPSTCAESDQIVGTVCHFKCEAGYALYGPTSKECLLGGIWSNPQLLVTCHDTKPIPYPITFIISVDVSKEMGFSTRKCLQTSNNNMEVLFVDCDENNFHQKWKWFGSSQLKSISSEKCLRLFVNSSESSDARTKRRALYPGACVFDDLSAIRCGSLNSPASRYQISVGDALLGPYLVLQNPDFDVLDISGTNDRIAMLSWGATWVDYTRDPSYDMKPDLSLIPVPVCSYMCGGSIISESGNIASPNYPHEYPKNVHCQWIISLPDPEMELVFDLTSVVFQNTRFNHLRQGECSQDYLEIKEGRDAGAPSLRICSNVGPKRFKTYFGELQIVFHSDDELLRDGQYGWAAHWWSRELPSPRVECGNLNEDPVKTYFNPSQASGAAWQAFVVYQAQQSCNAAIYNKRFVITSAHCVKNFHMLTSLALKRSVVVVYGFSNQTELLFMFNGKQQKRAQRIWLHPKYSPNHATNDVALVMTRTDITLSENVQPICLTPSSPPSIYQAKNSVCWIVQWNHNVFIDFQPVWDFTYYIPVQILIQDDCIQLLKQHTNNKHNENFLCAQEVENYQVNPENTFTRASYRYSNREGSLLQCRWNQNWYLLGISTFAFEDKNKNLMFVFNAVDAYESWINYITINSIYLLEKEFLNLF